MNVLDVYERRVDELAAEIHRLRDVIRNERDPNYPGSLAFQLREALEPDPDHHRGAVDEWRELAETNAAEIHALRGHMAERDALRREVVDLREDLKHAERAAGEWRDRHAQLQRGAVAPTVLTAAQALERFGCHSAHCDLNLKGYAENDDFACTCGLDKVIAHLRGAVASEQDQTAADADDQAEREPGAEH